MNQSEKNTEINNLNIAQIANQGNAALAGQRNIAVVIAKCDINNITINNSNTTDVSNITGGAASEVSTSTLFNKTISGRSNFKKISITHSAASSQSNISIL